MLQYDFEDSVGYWIWTTSRAIERAMAAELRPLGMTFRQFQVLAALVLHGPVSQSEVAAFLQIEPPTLTGVLDRMERDGWIERVACPHDGRRKLVRPLPQAVPVWERVTERARAVRARAVLGFDDAARLELRDALARIRQNLEAAAPRENVR